MATSATQSQAAVNVGLPSLVHIKKAQDKAESFSMKLFQATFSGMWMGLIWRLLYFAVMYIRSYVHSDLKKCKQTRGRALSSGCLLPGSPRTCCASLENI